jgi:DNA-binding NarL/FixJ family response regulator
MIRIVLAEDHGLLRQGLKMILETEPEFEVVGETGDGLQAIKLVSELCPDILVTDLKMPGADGIRVTQEVASVSPVTRVVVLSLYDHVGYASSALQAGAKAYIPKGTTAEDLAKAIRAVMEDRLFLSPPLSEETIEDYRRKTQAHLPGSQGHTTAI